MQWVLVNVVACAVGVFMIFGGMIPNSWKPWVLASIAILRTFADYWLAWPFYFPQEATPALVAMPAVAV